MPALVVVESCFGNTRHIAETVVTELEHRHVPTDVVDVGDAPDRLAPDLDLLVVGAPTHEGGMSTPQSRASARELPGCVAAESGVREWIDRLSLPDRPLLVAVFDTRTGFPWLAGSAAAQASVLLSHKGFSVLADRATFRVNDVAGPLQPGEDQRARRWAERLAVLVERRRLSRDRSSADPRGVGRTP